MCVIQVTNYVIQIIQKPQLALHQIERYIRLISGDSEYFRGQGGSRRKSETRSRDFLGRARCKYPAYVQRVRGFNNASSLSSFLVLSSASSSHLASTSVVYWSTNINASGSSRSSICGCSCARARFFVYVCTRVFTYTTRKTDLSLSLSISFRFVHSAASPLKRESVPRWPEGDIAFIRLTLSPLEKFV